jgi:peptidoglycan/LPS O-acetylase OafA/YrhL
MFTQLTIATFVIYFTLGALAGAYSLVHLSRNARKHISLRLAVIAGSLGGGILYIAIGQAWLVPPVGGVILSLVTLICLFLMVGRNTPCRPGKRAIF